MSTPENPAQTIARLLSSEVRVERLTLFHGNPGLVDNLQGVSRRLGYDDAPVERELKDLADIGIIRTKKVGKMVVYALDTKRDKQVQESIANHISAFKGVKA